MAHPKRPRDANQLAKMIVDISTGDIDEEMPEMSPKARAGQKGGLKGGLVRARKLMPKQRSEIARRAANARWKKSD